MQITGDRRAVTFHDVGDDGRIARRNRFEVLFQGSERFVTTELTREIFSAMTLQRFSSGMWAQLPAAPIAAGMTRAGSISEVADVDRARSGTLYGDAIRCRNGRRSSIAGFRFRAAVTTQPGRIRLEPLRRSARF